MWFTFVLSLLATTASPLPTDSGNSSSIEIASINSDAPFHTFTSEVINYLQEKFRISNDEFPNTWLFQLQLFFDEHRQFVMTIKEYVKQAENVESFEPFNFVIDGDEYSVPTWSVSNVLTAIVRKMHRLSVTSVVAESALFGEEQRQLLRILKEQRMNMSPYKEGRLIAYIKLYIDSIRELFQKLGLNHLDFGFQQQSYNLQLINKHIRNFKRDFKKVHSNFSAVQTELREMVSGPLMVEIKRIEPSLIQFVGFKRRLKAVRTRFENAMIEKPRRVNESTFGRLPTSKSNETIKAELRTKFIEILERKATSLSSEEEKEFLQNIAKSYDDCSNIESQLFTMRNYASEKDFPQFDYTGFYDHISDKKRKITGLQSYKRLEGGRKKMLFGVRDAWTNAKELCYKIKTEIHLKMLREPNSLKITDELLSMARKMRGEIAIILGDVSNESKQFDPTNVKRVLNAIREKQIKVEMSSIITKADETNEKIRLLSIRTLHEYEGTFVNSTKRIEFAIKQTTEAHKRIRRKLLQMLNNVRMDANDLPEKKNIVSFSESLIEIPAPAGSVIYDVNKYLDIINEIMKRYWPNGRQYRFLQTIQKIIANNYKTFKIIDSFASDAENLLLDSSVQEKIKDSGINEKVEHLSHEFDESSNILKSLCNSQALENLLDALNSMDPRFEIDKSLEQTVHEMSAISERSYENVRKTFDEFNLNPVAHSLSKVKSFTSTFDQSVNELDSLIRSDFDQNILTIFNDKYQEVENRLSSTKRNIDALNSKEGTLFSDINDKLNANLKWRRPIQHADELNMEKHLPWRAPTTGGILKGGKLHRKMSFDAQFV